MRRLNSVVLCVYYLDSAQHTYNYKLIQKCMCTCAHTVYSLTVTCESRTAPVSMQAYVVCLLIGWGKNNGHNNTAHNLFLCLCLPASKPLSTDVEASEFRRMKMSSRVDQAHGCSRWHKTSCAGGRHNMPPSLQVDL